MGPRHRAAVPAVRATVTAVAPWVGGARPAAPRGALTTTIGAHGFRTARFGPRGTGTDAGPPFRRRPRIPRGRDADGLRPAPRQAHGRCQAPGSTPVRATSAYQRALALGMRVPVG